jgi:Uma2 family endonuclease
MNVQLPVHMDKAAFLAWVQGLEGRYELAQGRVVVTVGATRTHAIIVGNLTALLQGQLDSRQWIVLGGFGLDTGPETLRCPDIVVDQAGVSAGDIVATAPTFLAEVLSESTTKIDLGDKAAEYLRLPSLMAYLVFADDEHKAYLWTRETNGFSTPSVIAGRDKIIRIAAQNLILPIGAIYAGVAFN